MSKETAIIADVQRCTTKDGPGLRTTVFFKGCPLRCAWCHNPECIDPNPQTMVYPEKCLGCGKCDLGCFSGAKVTCGKSMSASELLEEILQDKAYYEGGGGVTFSGGEPLLQRDFLSNIIDLCHENGIHCAIETSLCVFDEEILQKVDLIMADLKIWDDDLHKQYTGVSNEKIKENFIKTNALGVPIIARTPIIPEIHQEIDKISDFLKELSNVKAYELLPYHPLGEDKRSALGIVSPYNFTVPTKDFMKELEKYVFIR